MGRILAFLAFFFIYCLPLPGAKAQCAADGSAACPQGIPHFVKISGVLKSSSGAVLTGSTAVRFVIYGDSTGGTPLWLEVQNVQLDPQGHYDITLGATDNDGVPMELFTSGESRWLGVQALRPGEDEQPRVLMVSVPYALVAANAQSLGGLPASAYAKAIVTPVNGVSTSSDTASSNSDVRASTTSIIAGSSATAPAATPTGTVNTIPKFAAGSALVNSQITDVNNYVSVQNLDNTLFADRFAGGVADAVAACPANGCFIYAGSPNVNLNLGTIDPGTKAITIYLGPYTYTVKQITLRKSLKIIGMGASGGPSGTPACSVALPCNGTSLQSVNGNNPVFVLPQSNNSPATNVLLTGFRVFGSPGNTSEDGFLLDSSTTQNDGLWYSTMDGIYLEGFAGVGIHVKGRSNDFAAATQWVLFNNVIVYRTRGGGNALRLEGATFELRFRNCEFDGQQIGDGTNIFMGGTGGGAGGYPISIVFEGLVSQQAATAVHIDGGANLIFNTSHHELLFGGYSITNNFNIATHGLVIENSYFAGNVGVNAGTGYALSIGTTLASGIVFKHNEIFGDPDIVIAGNNFASVVYQDNFYAGSLNGPPTSGLTTQMSPAASINLGGVHSVGLNPSTTAITTIQSGLGPGETVSFFTLGGPVTFASGGNIDLMGAGSITLSGTITFVRVDLGGPSWKPVSQWSPATPKTQ